MLVLKRKVGDTVMLGDDIEVTVLGVEGENVKLGFTAPQSVQILRKELYDSIRLENLNAGQAAIAQEQVLHLLKQIQTTPKSTK
jgi:carbon storage regulator